MFRELMKKNAYEHAPDVTFAVFHPADAVRLGKFKRDVRDHSTGLKALGAAAILLPLGIWLGKKRAESNGHVSLAEEDIEYTVSVERPSRSRASTESTSRI